jgi:hypothetical protein
VNTFFTIATYVTPQAAREAQGVLVGAGFEAMVEETRLRVPDVDAILADVLEQVGEWPAETEEVEELPVETGCECAVCEPILRARGPLFLVLVVVALKAVDAWERVNRMQQEQSIAVQAKIVSGPAFGKRCPTNEDTAADCHSVRGRIRECRDQAAERLVEINAGSSDTISAPRS